MEFEYTEKLQMVYETLKNMMWMPKRCSASSKTIWIL